MKYILALYFLLVTSAVGAGGQYSNELFTIDSPKGSFTSNNNQPVLLSLPQEGGITPNVNVQIQLFEGSMHQYLALTENQMKSLNWTILNSKVSDDTLFLEYSGIFQGVHLHWYAEAIKSRSLVYLITATAAEKHWNKVSANLIESVKSFRLK